MRSSISLFLLLFLGLSACAHSHANREELIATEAPFPSLGVIASLDSQRLALQVSGSDQPQIFARTIQSQVICGGQEVDWEALEVGAPVRLRWTQGVSGPALVVTIELLQGVEGDAVQREVEQGS